MIALLRYYWNLLNKIGKLIVVLIFVIYVASFSYYEVIWWSGPHPEEPFIISGIALLIGGLLIWKIGIRK